MFRFFTTLVVTGVGLMAASAWWSERESQGAMPEPANEKAVAAPEAERSLTGPRPESESPQALAETAPNRNPSASTKPMAAAHRVPAIPAPRLVDPAEYTRFVAPVPDAPEPVPSPLAPATLKANEPADGVHETLIPEPAAFEDEILVLAAERASDGSVLLAASQENETSDDENEPYGEENVFFIDEEPGFVDPDLERRAIAMRTDHDASADRIRRLLDVYESLGSRR